MAAWTLEDIAWGDIDRTQVTPDILALVKAASLVESNALDYREYLCNVFADDARFQQAVTGWAEEEQRHGAALARWAALVDPAFDFDASFRKFIDGYRIPVGAGQSVRGSRCGELIARCMVETGTNSFYSALAQATEEPVLKQICQHIADDEMAHYEMFHRHLRRYLDVEKPGFLMRLRIALGRIAESEDDELAYAYFAANGRGEPYDRRLHGGTYSRQAFAYYSPPIIRRAVEMVFAAVGFKGSGVTVKIAAFAASSLMQWRRRWTAWIA